MKLTTDFQVKENELVYGHNPNRDGYAWVLENVQMIDGEEINGKLGLWNL